MEVFGDQKSFEKSALNISKAFFACLTTLAFSLDLSVYAVSEVVEANALQSLANLFLGIHRAIGWSQLEMALIATALFLIYRRYFVFKQSKIGNHLLSLFLSLWLLCDRALAYQNHTISLLWENHTQLFKSLICFVGFYVLCLALLSCAEQKLNTYSSRRTCVLRHPFGTPFVIILCNYLFCAVIRYPGVLLWDTVYQLGEFFGERAFRAMNPPVHTAFCGWFAQFGDIIGKPQLGLFLMMLIQLIALAGICAYFVSLLQNWRAPAWLVWLLIFLPALSPVYTSYVTMVSKDSAYVVSMLLFVIQTALWVLERERFTLKEKHRLKNWMLWAVAGVMSIWLRKNGIYVVGLTAAGMILMSVFRGRNLRERILTIVCTIIVLAVGLGVEKLILSAYHVEKGSIREVLSLPFQQTALVMREKADSIPQHEWQIIDQVLDADLIGEVYLPYISDPVKATYRESATFKDLLDYFGIWFRQMLRYPALYLDGMMGLIYNLFSPLSGSVSYEMHNVTSVVNGWNLAAWYREQPFYHFNQVLYRFWQMISSWPVLGLTVSMGVYSDALLALLIFAARKKIKGFFLCAFPVFLSLVFLVFSPICYTRYALVLYYGVPVLIAFYVVFSNKNQPHAAE